MADRDEGSPDPFLRLATAPGTIDLADPLSAPAIEAVLDKPALARLARCFAVAVSGAGSGAGYDLDTSLLADWPWE